MRSLTCRFATTAATRVTSGADAERMSDIMALLNHIEDTVDETLKKTPAVESAKRESPPVAVGTTGTIQIKGAASNTVTIERDKLEEIRAVEQLKVLLKQ